jgi:hypothetical protein
MHLLFIDEFGHENTKAQNQAPVFGYGGFMIPAESFSEFSAEFFDIKVAAFKPLYQARLKDQPTTTEGDMRARDRIKAVLERLSHKDPIEYFHDPELRQTVARYEIKGSQVFSASYLLKMWRQAVDRDPSLAASPGVPRGMVRFALWLLRSLQYYGGEVFYVGFHRSRAPLLRRNEGIHVALVKNVIERAYAYAALHNSTVQIVFDHHYTDVGPSKGPKGLVTGIVPKSRADRAREIVMSKGYYENLTEPVFNAKSHLSQGVQAADWLCALLRILFIHRAEGVPGYAAFASRVDEAVFSNAVEQSEFLMMPAPIHGRLYEGQAQLALRGGINAGIRTSRPYRK